MAFTIPSTPIGALLDLYADAVARRDRAFADELRERIERVPAAQTPPLLPGEDPETALAELREAEYLRLCRQYGIAEAGTFPSSREAADSYPPDFGWDLGDGQRVRNDELGDDDDVLG